MDLEFLLQNAAVIRFDRSEVVHSSFRQIALNRVVFSFLKASNYERISVLHGSRRAEYGLGGFR